MKAITTIESNLEAIQQKLDIGASDWTKEEKEDIEKCYFEITKVSVGRGRTVDLACADCVRSAVNVIKNYQSLIARAEQEPAEGAKVIDFDSVWKATVKTVTAKALELEFTFTKDAKTKADKIAELEAYMSEIEIGEEVDEDDDFLGEEIPTRAQMVEFVKATTGEDTPDDVTDEELSDYVKQLQDDEQGTN